MVQFETCLLFLNLQLKSGYYSIKVLYTSFRQEGMLKVRWSGPGLEMQEIKAENLYHKEEKEKI